MKKYLLATAVAISVLCAGCGKTKTDEAKSPNLVQASISSYNNGTQSSQFVQVNLEFDKKITIEEKNSDSLRITIGGERVTSDEYELEPGDEEGEAILTISVDAVTNGVLKITKSEKSDVITDITDASGNYAVNEFELEGLIPSGVTLSDVDADETSVTKQVDSAWNIRSIAWICLTKDGEVIPVNEDDVNEQLDGYAAVHGHEFLIEDEAEIAEKMVDTLSRVYGAEYEFSSNGARITAKNINSEEGNYDIQIYQYLKINGEDVVLDKADTQSESSGEDEDESAGLKYKVSEVNREATDEEAEFMSKLHISDSSEDQIKDGTQLYQTLTITGEAMPEEEIYSVRDLEELIQLSFENESMYELELPKTLYLSAEEETVLYGLDYLKLLELCGVDIDREDLQLTAESADGTQQSLNLGEMIAADTEFLLAFATQDGPLASDLEPVSGEIALVAVEKENVTVIGNVTKMVLGSGDDMGDPGYRFHNREPYSQDNDKTLTIEVYQKNAEYLGAVRQKTFTTEEFELLMQNNPEHVVRNYYGTIANSESYLYMGNGGWLDFFEGLDFAWILTDQMNITDFSGYAELYGRDGEVYAQIDDLTYLSGENASKDYYVLSSDGYKIPNAIPMIACTKNGYPMLPDHDHESVGYIAYNHLNDSLQSLGIETEVGVVKNHNGPFVACLGNLDGYYGGYQMETGGDCVLIKLYLDEL
jgi:hypothetical protein